MGKIKTAITTILVGIIFIFIMHNLYVNWSKLADFTFQIDFLYLVFSLIFLMLAWVMSVWIIRRLFIALGHDISFANVYVIYFRSIIGKYVPGKVWHIAGSTYIAARRGIPEGASVTAFLLGQTYSVLSGLILVIVVMALRIFGEPTNFIKGVNLKLLPVIIILAIFALKPKILETPINWILRFLNKEEIIINIGLKVGIMMLIYYMASWFTFGFSFWLFIKALIPVNFNQYITLTAIHSAAIVLGFLAIFAPGGIGVREGLIILLLSHITNYQVPFPTIIALGFRMITSISELISFGITWIIDR